MKLTNTVAHILNVSSWCEDARGEGGGGCVRVCLGGEKGGETVVEMYCMREESIFNKKLNNV